MKNNIIVIIAILSAAGNILFSQDTILNKLIYIKTFNLKSESYMEREISFSDCKSVVPLSDSSFKIFHSKGKDIILFKSINEISFKGKRRTWEGIWKGGVTGGIAGIFTMLFFPKTFFHSSIREGGGGFIVFIIYESLSILTGATVGGIIGGLSFDYDNYDFSKYKLRDKKNETLKLFLKYRVNL